MKYFGSEAFCLRRQVIAKGSQTGELGGHFRALTGTDKDQSNSM